MFHIPAAERSFYLVAHSISPLNFIPADHTRLYFFRRHADLLRDVFSFVLSFFSESSITPWILDETKSAVIESIAEKIRIQILDVRRIVISFRFDVRKEFEKRI